ncbi:MAG: glycosyltransferase [Deltaproteobacteria bacterium]|nr:glycosyltransferase [Deltaproteobacteria bacterium]
MKPVLYISYDGLLDPLGYSQVQPYLRQLGLRGVPLRVLSFEKPELCSGPEIKQVKESLTSCGVFWHRLRYHKRPAVLSTLRDIAAGLAVARVLVLRHRIGIIHARSYIAAVIALGLCSVSRVRFLFDMRGFWVEERVEGGLWKKGGLLYRTFKRLEKKFLQRADAIVILSRRGAEILRGMLPSRRAEPRIEVIPTCVDLTLFRPGPVIKDSKDSLKLVYVGSLGTWYLIEEMVAFFGIVLTRLPESSFTLITPSDPAVLEQAVGKLNLPQGAAERIIVKSVPYSQVPQALAEADCSLFFIRPSFSKQASCATKFAESLACGRPVLINPGIGDHEQYVRSRNLGVVIEEFSQAGFNSALDSLLELFQDSSLASRCRSAAAEDFSLAGGAETYLDLYRWLSEDRGER